MIVQSREQQDRDISQMDDDEFGQMLDGQLVDRASLGLQSTRQVGLSADAAAQLVNMNVQALMPGGLAAMAADTILQTRQAQSFRERLASAPFTSAFIAADPLRGAVVEDSVDQLARAENFIARPTPERRGILGALALQPRNIGAGGVSAVGMTARGAGETAMAAETVVPNLVARGFGPLGLLMGVSDRFEQATGVDVAEEAAGILMQTQAGQFLTRATAPTEAGLQQAGELLYDAGEGIQGAAEFIRPEDQTIVGQVFEGLGQLATAVAASFVPGGQAVTVTSFGMMGVDQQAQAMRANGLEPNAFPDQLIAGFVVTSASEQMRLGSMLRILPPSVRRSGVAQVVSRILGQAAEEGIQEGIEGVAHGIIQRTYDEDANPFDGVLQEMTVAGASAALFQILVEGIIPGRARSMRTEQATTMLDEINAAVSEAPATQRSRQTVQDFIDEVGDEGSIYLSPEGVTTLYQSEGGMETLADIGLTEDDVAAAQFEGRDAQVNVGRLVTSQFYEQVRDHVRVDPGDPTAAEVQAGIMRDVLDVDLREAARMIATDIAQDEEAAQIGEIVALQLESAGRSADEARAAGALYTAVFKGLAERTGQSARELFERVGLRVQSGMAATPPQEGAQTLEQFAGVNALTADMGALDEAVRRLEAGEDPSVVRRETGWFRGVDGELRFEISDEGMQFIQEPGEDGVLTGALGDLIQHEELFAAYPNLRNLPATIRVGPQRRGQFDGQRLEANGATREEALAVAAHEIQHAIQQIENFARGGSPQEMAAQLERVALSPEVRAVFTGPLVDPIPGIAKRLAASIQYPEGSVGELAVEMALQRHAKTIALASGDRRRAYADLRVALTSRAEMRASEATDQANRLLDELLATPEHQALAAALTEAARASEPFTRLDPNVQDTPYILYVRQAGEAEARDTEASLRLTAEQRRERDPESAFGVAEGQNPVMAYPFAPQQQIVTAQRQPGQSPFANPRTLNQSAAPITMKPLDLATNKRVRLRDIAAAFTRRHMEEYGRKLDPIKNEADREIVVNSMLDEVQFQLEHGEGDAEVWYTEDIAEALRITQTIIPEIADPVYADLLLAFAAMTSPNENPINNWDMAVELTRRFIDDGVIPTTKINPDGTPKLKPDGTPTSFGLASGSAIPLANYMIRTMGVEGFVEFMQTRHSGREFAEIRKASGVYTEKKALSGYTPKEVALRDEGLPGSWIFGPKVGEFMMNATGYDVNAVTVDLWNWRTYSRLIGGLQDYASKKERDAGIVSGDGLNKVSRRAIREMETEVAERVGHTPSAVQALLWFFEQRLYRVHGSESDSFTFSDGARKAVERRGYYVSRAGDGGGLQGQARTFDQSAIRPSPVDVALAAETFGNLQAEYSLDQIYEVAPDLNEELNNDLEAIAVDIGATVRRGPMKKRETAEEKMQRKNYRHTGKLADIMRGTILIETPAQYLEVVNRLRRKYDVLDEGWRMPAKAVGYYDAKLTVRFSNGMLGEVQLMPEAMFFIKHFGEGHRLYEAIRARDAEGRPVLSKGEMAEAEQASYDLYKLGISGSAVWRSTFAILEAAEGNISANRLAEMTWPLSAISAGSEMTQAPEGSSNISPYMLSGASGNVAQMAGRYSQFQNLSTSMGSPFDLSNVNDQPTVINRQGDQNDPQAVRGAPTRRELVGGRVARDARPILIGEGREVLEISDPEVFGELIQEAKDALGPVGAQVTVYDDYAGKRLFLMDNGRSGFALDGDDIISVFAHPDAEPGMAKRALEVATELGGRRLDAFDTFLPKLYARNGFRAVAKLGFNREFAPEGWDYDFFAENFPQTGGEPDVVFMVYDPENASGDTDNVVQEYDDGLAAQRKELLGRAEAGRPIPDADGVIRVNGREYRARRPGEPLKAYMKAEIDTREAPESLPFEPDRFFDLSQPHQMVPIDQIQSSKTDEENQQGGSNAPKRFLAAYDGILEPRGPITVTANGDGTYTIVDGNGTYTAFRNYGWPAIPVQVVDGEGRVLEQGGATDTEAFRRWFGDSKVVDENGDPLVVYHGSRSEAPETLDPSKARAGLGVYATPTKEFAEDFAEGSLVSGYVAADDVIDLRNYGPFVDRDDVADIADDLGVDPEALEKSWDRLSRAGGDVFMFNLLEAGDFLLAEGQAVRFEDWGEGSAEEAIVFSGGSMFKSTENVGTFDPNDPRFLNQGGEGPRAQIQIPAGGVLAEQDTIIRLTEAADATSFLHESGHLFLEIYAALEGDGFPEVNEIMRDIRKWVGARPGEALTREQHERFAESFEAYLREGKAPAPELKTAFRKFAKWITEVYRNMTGQLPNLDPEITAIFDKMLAGQAEVAAQEVQSQRGLAEALAGIMGPDEIAKHESLRQRAAQEARDGIIDRIARRMERANRREVRERLATLRKEAREELAAQPLHKTMQAIFEGDLPQLNRTAAEAIVGADVLARLPRGKRGLLTNEGGETDLETFADRHGWASAETMLNEMAATEPLKKAAYDLAERRAEAEGIVLMTDAEINAAAQQETFSTASSEIMQAELNALSRKAAIRGIPLAAIRQEAKRRIESQPIEEVVKPGLYAIQSRSRHKKALREAARGNWAEAVRLMQQALMHHEMARLAYKARDEIQRGRRFASRFNPRGIKKIVEGDRYFPELIPALRDIFALPGAENAGEMVANVNRIILEGNDGAGWNVQLPARVEEGRPLPSQRAMTLTEFREWVSALKQTAKAARDAQSAARGARYQENLDIAFAIEENAGLNHPIKEGDQQDRGFLAALGRKTAELYASLRRLPFYARVLDGGKEGPFYRAVIAPLRAATNASTKMKNEAQDWMQGFFARHANNLRFDKMYFSKALNREVSGEEIFALLANTGNESNVARLLSMPARPEGGVSDVVDPKLYFPGGQQQLQAFIDEMGTPERMTAVQEIWDRINSYWPEIAALQERTTGVRPQKVEATPVTAQGQTYRGGYYPLQYDPDTPGTDPSSNSVASGRAYDELKVQRGGAVVSSTRQGHTKERAKSVNKRILLKFDVVTRHIDNITHDLAFREVFNDVWQRVTSKPIETAGVGAIGRENYAALKEMVRIVVAGPKVPQSPMEHLLRGLRTKAVTALLGINVRVVATQPLALIQAATRIKKTTMIAAMAQYVADPVGVAQAVMKRSVYMQNRSRVMTRDIKEMLRENKRNTPTDRVRAMSLWLMQKIDVYGAAIPAWLAAYNSKMEEGWTSKDAALYADTLIADTMGGGEEMDLSTAQTSDEVAKMFTFMYGYFSSTMNLSVEALQDIKRGRVAKGLSDLFLLHVVQGTLALLIMEGLPGDDDDDGDLVDDYAALVAMGTLESAVGSLPGAREVLSSFRYGSGQKTPFGSFVDTFARAGSTAYGIGEDAFTEGEVEADKVWRFSIQSLQVAGLATGLPTYQVGRTIDAIVLDESPSAYEIVVSGRDRDED